MPLFHFCKIKSLLMVAKYLLKRLWKRFFSFQMRQHSFSEDKMIYL